MSEHIIQIPLTIESAIDALTGIDRLLTAREWERAAIVFAFTRDGGKVSYQSKKNDDIDVFSPEEFAGLGIAGLRAASTVRIYRTAWRTAIEHGHAEPVSPGQTVSLPDMEWPKSSRVQEDKTPAKQAADVRSALADPVVRQLVAEELVETVAADPKLTSQALIRAAELRPSPPPILVREDVISPFTFAYRAVLFARSLEVDVDHALRPYRHGVDDINLRRVAAQAAGELRLAADQIIQYAETIERVAGVAAERLDHAWIDSLLERG